MKVLHIATATFLALTIAVPVLAHPAHVTLAEAEWNEETGKLEVALQVRPYDLEQALRLMTKQAVDLDKTDNIDDVIQTYLNRSVVLTKGKEAARLQWVGKEVNARDAWLYFEVPLPGGLAGWKMRHTVFFETLPNQVNTVTFRHGQRKQSLSFTQDHAVHPLPQW